MRRLRVDRLPHRYLRATLRRRPVCSTPGSRIDEPSRDGAAEGDRPKAIGLRGGLGKAGFRAQRSGHTRIVAGPESDAWRMCATHRTPNDRAKRHLVARSRAQRLTMGFTGPRWCACVRVSDMPAAVSSRVALRAVVEWPKAVDVSRLRPFQPFRSWVLRAVDPEGSDLKRSTKSKAVVEGWRLIATDDELKLPARPHRVKGSDSSPG